MGLISSEGKDEEKIEWEHVNREEFAIEKTMATGSRSLVSSLIILRPAE